MLGTLKASRGSSRQFDSVVPGIEPMKHVDLSDAVNVAVYSLKA